MKPQRSATSELTWLADAIVVASAYLVEAHTATGHALAILEVLRVLALGARTVHVCARETRPRDGTVLAVLLAGVNVALTSVGRTV